MGKIRKNIKELAMTGNPIIAPPRDIWTKGTWPLPPTKPETLQNR